MTMEMRVMVEAGFRYLLMLMFALLASACATTQKEEPHVLSGEAPVEKVIAQADEAYRAGDHQAAAILYQIAIGKEPEAEIWYRLGLANVQLGHGAQALYSFAKAQDLDPDHQGALERLSLYYTAEGDQEHALEYLGRLLIVAPDNWKAHNALGVLADRRQDFDEARVHYVEALKLRPDLALIWNNLGYSVYLMGDSEAAVRYIARALELDPAHKPSRKNLALVYVHQQQFQRALDTFLEVGDAANAFTQVGYLAYKTGQVEKAEELLLEAIRSSPTYNKLAHSYLAAVRQAS